MPGRSGVQLLPDLSRKTALTMARRIAEHETAPGDRVVVSIHWGENWGFSVPAEQERFAKVLIDKGGVDLVHGHSSHHPKGMEVYRGRLILYGAGDLLDDYEGIGGYEEFRPELTLIYLPRLDRSGALGSVLLLPMRRERFRLNRTTAEETGWLLALLRRLSRGLRFELTADSLLVGYPSR